MDDKKEKEIMLVDEQALRDKVEVSPSELSNLSISQNVISIQTAGVKGGRSKPIHAFTEQGIYMLMTVLHGPLVEVLNLRSQNATSSWGRKLQSNS